MGETGPGRVSDEAGAILVEDLERRSVRLDSLWKAQPALLVFLRHFG
jgi:hypothetical protein